jgi:hypothetical protein
MLLHKAESRNSVHTSAKVKARFLPSGVVKSLLAIIGQIAAKNCPEFRSGGDICTDYRAIK